MDSKLLLALKKHIAENRRHWLMICAVVIGIPALFGIWLGLFNIGPGEGTFLVYNFLATGVWLFLVAGTFPELKTLQGRIQLLMTPIPATYTIFIRLAFAFVIVPAILCAGYMAFWATDLLTCGIIHHNWTAEPIFPGYRLVGNEAAAAVNLVGQWLFSGSAYFLGAILWPRMSFLKTSGILIALFLFLSLIVAGMVKGHSAMLYLADMDFNPLVWIWTGVLYTLDIAMIWFAFYRYRRLQVI